MSISDVQAMSNQPPNANGRPPATLEFKQAMKDFKTMFPTLDMELIECVLRSNSGRVDATVDQLLQLSKDPGRQNYSRRQRRYHTRHIAVDYDSTDSGDSFHSELLDGPTSSDDDMNLRDPPPMYTPHADDPVEFFPAPSYPTDTSAVSSKQSRKGNSNRHLTNGNRDKKKYRAWNPPMLGTLPDDFLRILPQQFLDPKEKPKLQKSLSHPQRHQFVSKPVLKDLVTTNDASVISQAFGIDTSQSERTGPPPGLTGPAIDDGFGNGIGQNFDAMNPPPRPPRTIPTNQSRRKMQPNPWHPSDHVDHGNSLIRTASDCQHRHTDSTSNSHRSRHHHSHHGRSSRQLHSSRNHSFQSQRCNHTRKSNDFTSRRMVMVSRLSEPALPITHNGVSNGIDSNHTPSSNSNRTHHRSSSSRNTSSHNIAVHSRRRSPNSVRNELQWHPAQSSSSHRPSSTNSVRSRPRTSIEEDQYVEDCRLAILLQNEEFIRELKRNDEFLKELEKDRLNGTQQPSREDRDKEIIASPDPDAKYTHGFHNGNALTSVNKLAEDTDKDDKAFKENLKHMSKSARKKFNELAKKFSVRRKSSYKSMKNIDPVFADCDDEFERRRTASPTFDLKE